MTSSIQEWLSKNQMKFQDLGMGRFKVADRIYYEVQGEKVLNLSGKPMLALDDYATAQSESEETILTHFAFKFGGRYYQTEVDRISIKKLVPLRYVGEVVWQTPIEKGGRAHLGIHGKYELMSGLHDYDNWTEKGKFLGYDALGICEKGTLAGAIQFSQACKKQGIKPILGLSLDIKHLSHILEIKLFAVNQTGWENIMYVNASTELFTPEELHPYLKGVIVIIPSALGVDGAVMEGMNKVANKVFFQISTTTFEYENKDIERLDNIKWYLREYKQSGGEVTCLIDGDSYCLEKDQEHLRSILVKQSGKKRFLTKNHAFNGYDNIVRDYYKHFEKEDVELFRHTIFESGNSMSYIKEVVQFDINTKELHLPAYEMPDDYLDHYTNNEDLFKALISDNLSKIDFNKHPREEVYARIKTEGEVIKKGGFIDYFLILWDIVEFCKEKKIEVGPGRGSAAGALISYLLGITKINPLDYGLLFERFLNESRIESELPDIDLDFQSDRRDEVLSYMRDKYTFDHVCQVGTYGTLKLKSALKELNRYFKLLKPEEINYLAKLFSTEEDSFFDIFKVIANSSNRRLIAFVREHHSLLHDVESIIGALKNSSIHACATIIVPKKELGKGVTKQIPIRVHDDGTLVSEWEGEELAKAGYLKEDILSTLQMSKISNMIRLVEEHTGNRIDTETIPLDDSAVYDLFCQGYNSDVFHFGSTGLTTYLKSVQPRCIEDLIAAIALYRPGAMASDSHMEFVKLKNGEKEPEYDFMMEEVTKDTYGLYIYQEQIMKAVQVLGGFTLTEADGVRKAMGKKIVEKMDSYGKQFKANAVKKGCSLEEAQKIWDKLEVFSSYGFNKSHAAAYSVIGYMCNWFKSNYPFEFWITTFEFAKEDDIPQYLSEVAKASNVRVSPPEINKSTNHFEYDIDLQTLYWDLSKIKHVGSQAVEAILIERKENGEFFSIDEFLYRMEMFDIESRDEFKVNPVNKRVVENLILAGAFDDLHKLQENFSRYNLMCRYYETRKEKVPAAFIANSQSKHYWPIQQYEVCKFSSLDYRSLVQASKEFEPYIKTYLNGEEFNLKTTNAEVMVIGLVESYDIRTTKKGDAYALIRLLHNSELINIRVWPSELNSEDVRLQFEYSHRSQDTVVNGTLENVIPLYVNKIAIVRGKLELPDQWKNFNELVLSTHLEGSLIKFFD